MSSGCRGQGTGTGAVDGRGAAGGDLCGGGAALHLDSGRGPRDPHAPRDSCTRPPRQGHAPDLSCTLSGCTVRGAGLGSSRSPRWEVGVKVGRLYPGTHFWPRRCPPECHCSNPSASGTPGSLVQPPNRNEPLSAAPGVGVLVRDMCSPPAGPMAGCPLGPQRRLRPPAGPTR